MVDVGMEKVYPVHGESESWLAKARQNTLSRSPDKSSPSLHQPRIFYIFCWLGFTTHKYSIGHVVTFQRRSQVPFCALFQAQTGT
jgi:hypothetical protein